MSFVFATPPRLVCGPGVLVQLAQWDFPTGERPFVVTDPGIIQAGLLARLLEPLAVAGVRAAVFDQVVADPPESVVLAAAQLARRHRATAIIGFGGGSAMDVAKLVALLARDGAAPLHEAYGVNQVRGTRLPLALVPTTAGTGSEVTPIAIVTTGEQEKKGVVSPVLLPDLAVLDASLTLGLPRAVTAATGIDAMVHAIEAYTSASANNNPISRSLAREALRLLGANLETVLADASDLQARQQMLLGACLAGQAFANSPVGAVHALAYPLGARYHLPHGVTNALMLGPVMRFNLAHARQAYEQLLPCAFEGVTQGGAKALIDRLEALIARSGIALRLRDVGVPARDIPMLAADAMNQTRLLANNPRPLMLQDAMDIYTQAW